VVDFLAVRGEGDVGPTSRGIVRKDAVVQLTFLVGPPIAAGTKATLTCNVKKMDGSTARVLAWTNMKAGTSGYAFNRDSAPAAYTQEFLVEDALASNNFSEA
jgi:hypothetical protein